MPDVKSQCLCQAMTSAAMDGTYKTVLTLTNPSRMLVIYNGTDALATISFDGGTTDNMPLAAGATFIQDVNANHTWDAEYLWATGTVIQAKGGGTGSVYATSFYAG